MNVLIACEESGRVCEQFRLKGHNAFSCDIIETSGSHPEWHIMGDVMNVLDGDLIFETQDGKTRSKTFPGIVRAMAEQWG